MVLNRCIYPADGLLYRTFTELTVGAGARNNRDGRTSQAAAVAAALAVRYAYFDAPLRAAHGAYQPFALAGVNLYSGTLRDNNGRIRSDVRGLASRIDRFHSYRRPSHRDVAHGPGASYPVLDYKAQHPAGGDVGVRLGVPAFNSGAGLGARRDLAFFCFLVLVSGLAAARMVEGDPGDLVRTCVSEPFARHRSCGQSIC